MPRRARKKNAYGIYHIILRGNGRKTIFEDDEDCRMFLNLMQKARNELDFRLYAYCLMGNHVHLLVREGEDTIEHIFRKVATGYAVYYNGKYDFSGHLFQGRYKSETVDSESYFLSVIRYICQNPVKAGLCANPREYRWEGCAGLWDNIIKTDRLKELSNLKDEPLETFLMGTCSGEHIEYDSVKRMTDRRAISVFCKINDCRNPQEIIGLEGNRQKEAVQKAEKAGISKAQICRITGMTMYSVRKNLE